ncbi:MAG: type IX secretion system outer membrane channel protein PorV [Odoribacter sp.]
MKKILLYIAVWVLFFPLSAQVVSTAVPFLTIGPDARGAGMGQVGAATKADVYSAFYNPAKYAFVKERGGVALSYVPWMRDLTSDLNLWSLNSFYRIDDKQTVALSGRFFTSGDYVFMNESGEEIGTDSPTDFALNVSWSRCFGKYFSAALGIGMVHSSLGEVSVDGKDIESANAFLADISVLYNRDLTVCDRKAHWGVGLHISNVGTKMNYIEQGEDSFLPANLRLGGAFDMDLCTDHHLMLAVDFTKLLVEGPDADGRLSDKSVFGSALSSFGSDNSPITWALGLEYNWKKMVFLRTGYQDPTEKSGQTRLFTTGVGGSYQGISLDCSYWLPVGTDDSPLKNSLKVSLAYCF